MTQRLEATLSGRVRLVMFRDFAQRRARRLGLVGWVRNETNGTVRVVAEGEEDDLARFRALLEKGSVLSRVDAVEYSFHPPTGEFRDFIIRY